VPNPGIIILDEEHEWTYKNDQTPRYHARTVAAQMAALTGAKLVLGSATPSLESWRAAQTGQFELLSLPGRIDDVPLPPVEIVNLTNELKKQNYSIFSESLTEKIHDRLAKKEQVVLLLNKRGYATAIVCRDCGEALECKNCAVPLTFHSFGNRCLCHLCGHFEPIPQACPACGSVRIKQLGTGTQKLESEIKNLFPKAKVLRADRDTTTAVGAHQKIYEQFKSGAADILVGTQIVAKGLDLPNVTLVGVLLADVGLHLPDFRAAEKTFSLLTQVAGRAGRADKPGEVVIQTYSPQHLALRCASQHDYLEFAAEEMKERAQFKYPPFGQIVKFEFVNPVEKAARAAAQQLAEEIKKTGLGGVHAAPGLITKIHNKYHWHALWRGTDSGALFQQITIPDGCRVDVDPVNVV
jgi:primosomal protein N' (replication factor Y)